MTKKKRVHETITQYNELRKKLEKLSEFMPISYPDRAKWFKIYGRTLIDLNIFESEILKCGINLKTISNAQIEVKLQNSQGMTRRLIYFHFKLSLRN